MRFKNLLLLLMLISIIVLTYSCSSDDEKVVEIKEPVASFQFEISGYEVTFTNYSENASSYEWDFGDEGSSTEESPKHTYSKEGDYTVTLTATGDGGSHEFSQTVTIEAEADTPADDNSAKFIGDWQIEPIAAALGVGPSQGDLSYWSNSDVDVTTRSCLFDDVWTFAADGTITLQMDGETWLEPWQGVDPEACGTPITPHDGSGSYTYTATEDELVVSGKGIFLGLAKAYNGGELGDSESAPESITYQIFEYTDEDDIKRMTLDIDISETQDGSKWWRFKLYSGELPVEETVPTTVEGSWKIEPIAAALGVGPGQGNTDWWSNSLDQVSERACFFDDVWTFNNDGTVTLQMDGETWLETWQGTDSEGCGTPIAPHDGSGPYTYTASETELTVNGIGIYLGIPKANNAGELSSKDDAPESITYQITELVESEDGVKRMTLDIDYSAEQNGSAWWRFKLISQ